MARSPKKAAPSNRPTASSLVPDSTNTMPLDDTQPVASSGDSLSYQDAYALHIEGLDLCASQIVQEETEKSTVSKDTNEAFFGKFAYFASGNFILDKEVNGNLAPDSSTEAIVEKLNPFHQILHKANCAQGIRTLRARAPAKNFKRQLLNNLASSFPGAFCSVTLSIEEYRSVLRAIISIQTQLFLFACTDRGDATFFADNELKKLYFQGLTTKGGLFESTDLKNKLKVYQVVAERRAHIRQFFEQQDTGEQTVNVEDFIRTYPWTDMREELCTVLARLAVKTDGVIKSSGGVEIALTKLEEFTPASSEGDGEVDDDEDEEDDENDDEDIVAKRPSSRPSKKFNQSQDNAEKESPFNSDEELEPDEDKEKRKTTSPQKPQKPQSVSEESASSSSSEDDDDDSEDAFEQAPKAPAIPKRKVRTLPFSPRKRKARGSDSSSSPPSPPITARNKQAWTDEQAESLLYEMIEFGMHWADIVKGAHRQSKRTKKPHPLTGKKPDQLKDKARNIKFNMMKQGEHIPKRLKYVRLTNNQKHTLAKKNIDYEEPDPEEEAAEEAAEEEAKKAAKKAARKEAKKGTKKAAEESAEESNDEAE